MKSESEGKHLHQVVNKILRLTSFHNWSQNLVIIESPIQPSISMISVLERVRHLALNKASWRTSTTALSEWGSLAEPQLVYFHVTLGELSLWFIVGWKRKCRLPDFISEIPLKGKRKAVMWLEEPQQLHIWDNVLIEQWEWFGRKLMNLINFKKSNLISQGVLFKVYSWDVRWTSTICYVLLANSLNCKTWIIIGIVIGSCPLAKQQSNILSILRDSSNWWETWPFPQQKRKIIPLFILWKPVPHVAKRFCWK